VNGVEMSGKSQEDVVSYLRSIKFGSVVNIIVSRLDCSSSNTAAAAPAVTAVIIHVARIPLNTHVHPFNGGRFVPHCRGGPVPER